MRNATRIIIAFLMGISSHQIQAQLKLPAIIGDHMVLQQQSKAPIWGWSKAGEKIYVHVDWIAEDYSAIADENGRWQVEVVTPDAGGPHAMVIKGSETLTLKNIMIGEVWLCSGQSNMEMPLEGWPNQPIVESEKYISEADYPDIRLFTVKKNTSYTPLNDCEGNWSPCSPELAAEFSATGFFFGLSLYKELNIPIGLIHSSWGGTPAEAWTNQKYIDKIPYFHTSSEGCDPKVLRERKIKAFESIQKDWLDDLGFLPTESTPEWTRSAFDDSQWGEMEVPADWNKTAAGHFEGVIELRYEINVPRKWVRKTTILDLGPIDEMDITFVNGSVVGQHLNVYDWAAFRSYKIPAGTLKAGKNLIAVQIANTSGLGGINGEAEKMKLYPEGDMDNWIPLGGEWKYLKGKSYTLNNDMPWCLNCSEPETPTTLYNGMIAPLIPYGIKGAIWYQGESNRYDGKLYADIFPNMIENWRDDWGQGDFSFYFVQIAPFTYRDEYSTGALKEAQLHSMKIPNTGMVVTSDVGSLITIHPPDKKTVGQRLAAWAFAKDYDMKDIPYCGPLYKDSKREGDKIRIFFDYSDEGLIAKGGELKHFLIAGEDMKFVPAEARIEKNTVLVYSKDVTNPTAVRFETSDVTNLFNLAGLPASPFRTDSK